MAMGAAFGAAACGGESTTSGRDDSGAECKDGDERPAGDGCNTCGCIDGNWACTAIGCPEICTLGDRKSEGCESCVCADTGSGPEWLCNSDLCCEPGSTRSTDDGCNTCTCSADQQWECTERDCATAATRAPVRRPAGRARSEIAPTSLAQAATRTATATQATVAKRTLKTTP
jgi:hypothetical protein